jgi:hypothetical protein
MKVKTHYLVFLIVMSLFSGALYAQDEKNTLPYGGSLMRDTLPDLSFQPDSTLNQKKKKKKKQKRNLFYGKKARKGYTREGLDAKQVVELFYVLKKNEEPTGYVDEIYVWDRAKAKVVKVRKEELKTLNNYRILHGPYTKYVGGKMMETGIFYVGTKHGRWEVYKWDKKWWLSQALVKGDRPIDFTLLENQQPILMGKTKYYKGFQKEAKITYYDFERTKVKEVIPYEFGFKTGDYYYFLENGQVLIKGHYGDGKKIGLWIEYFEDKYKKKRETQYPKDQWEEVEPVIKKEWNEKGTLIIIDGKKVDLTKKVETDPIKKALRKKK